MSRTISIVPSLLVLLLAALVGLVASGLDILWGPIFVLLGLLIGFYRVWRRDPFSWLSFYLATQGALVLVPSVYLAVTGDFEHSFAEASGVFSPESLGAWTAVAVCAFTVNCIIVALGYQSRTGMALARPLSRLLPSVRMESRRVGLGIVFFSLFGAFCYYQYLGGPVGLRTLLQNPDLRWAFEFGRNKYWKWGATCWPLASLIWVARYFSVGGTRLVWVHCGLTGLFWLTLGARGEIVNMLVSCAILYHYLVRRLRPFEIVCGALVGVGLLVGSTFYRSGMAAANSLKEILVGNYGGLSAFTVALAAWPTRFPFLWGESFLRIITAPVPRGTWVLKPVGIGHLFSTLLWPGSAGGPALSSSTEFYLNFGLPGMVLGMYGIGVAGRLIYSWLVLHDGRPMAIVLYSVLVFFGGAAVSDYLVDYAQRVLAILVFMLVAGSTGPRGRVKASLSGR